MSRLFLAGSVVLWVAGFLPAGADEANLVQNPGFEESGPSGLPAQWSGPANVYSRDTAVKHSGEASLKFVNGNPDNYVLCTQSVPLEKGQIYEVSAWVKTEKISGEDSGATICVECSDAQGKYLGGQYPKGVKGDSDWTLIKSVTPRVPENAGRCTISCYVRQGMTGTAWWDDISLRRTREKPMACVLMTPNYRGTITDQGPNAIRIRSFLSLRDYDCDVKDMRLTWRVTNAGKPVAHGAVKRLSETATDVVIPACGMKPGRYDVEVALTPKRGGEPLASQSFAVARRHGMPDRKAYIDEHNRLILDGRPFFPLGMYWGGIKHEELDAYADSAFNCLMPYSSPTMEQMNLARDHGLKVIYSVKDTYFGTEASQGEFHSEDDELPFVKAKIEAFRDHPALLAWYINDELPLEMLERLARHRQWNEDLDPGHPAWVVLYQVDQIRDYLPSYDVIGTDPYPIPDRAPSMAGEWTRKTVGGVCGSRPVWMVPQVFNWNTYAKSDKDKTKRPPTLEEMRSMAWQCIAEGANGLVFYSWFDIRRDPATPFDEQWAKVKTVAQEIKDMMPVLLSVERPREFRVQSAPWLHVLNKRLGAATFLILVNESREVRTARIDFPHRPKTVLEHGTAASVPLTRPGVIDLDMPPLAVRILEIR